MRHLINFVSGPNPYGADSFYELHVWAWKDNPNGAFADWNTSVSCAQWAAAVCSRPVTGGPGNPLKAM